MQEKIEIIVIALVAIICILISVLDFVGALDAISWVSQRISIMTLLAIGMIAAYLVSQHNRNFRNIEETIRRGNIEILDKITIDETNRAILNNINNIWFEREDDFQRLFDQAQELQPSENNEALKQFLRKCENDFDHGVAFGTKLRFPWDLNIVAVDLKGKIVYHSFESMISTRYDLDHPTQEILKRRNGDIFWVNQIGGKIRRIENFPFKKVLRFTKLYFREIPQLKAIVIIQSHISILPCTIKPKDVSGKTAENT